MQHNGELVGLMYLTTCALDVAEILGNFRLQQLDNFIIENNRGDLALTLNSETDGSPALRINAFQIASFFIYPEYMDRSVDFLEAGFELFPHIPYCVLSVPFTSMPHPVLDPFIAMRPKFGCSSPESFHVLDRRAFFASVHAKLATEDDLASMESIVTGGGRERIMQDVSYALRRRDTEQDTLRVVLLNTTSDERPIGFVVVDTVVDVLALRRQFQVDGFVRKGHHPDDRFAMIKHFFVVPQFAALVERVFLVSDSIELGAHTVLLFFFWR